MADVITRFKLETTQYDSKLRDASQALSQYARQASFAGKEFDKFTKDQAEAARSLGSISTSANNAKDKVRELVAAYNQAANAYNALTKEQQQSDWGKSLAESVQKLKGRITEAKQELYSMGDSGKSTSGIMDVLNDKFTINIDALKLFNAGMTAAKAALDVAKDAFFSCETNVDDWGRTVAATEGIYQSFLQTINSGNFSGFLSGIQQVIDKAKEAYNAMDDLNTRMTIINPERAKLQTRATELKAIIRREGKDSEAGKAAQEALRALEPAMSKAFEKESRLNYNAFRSQVDAKLAEAGIKLNKYSPIYQMLMQSFSNDDLYNEFKKRGKGSITTEFKNYNNSGTSTTLLSGYSKKVDTRNLEQKLLDLFTDEWRETYSPYLTASFSAKGAAASVLLSDARYLKEGGGGGGKGGKKTPKPTEAMDLLSIGGIGDTSLLTQGAEFTLPLEIQVNVDSSELTALKNELKQLTEDQSNFGKYSSEAWQLYQEKIDEVNKKIQNFKGKDLPNQAEEAAKAFDSATNAIANIGSALQSIEDPGAKVAGIIAQAIATIAETFAASLKGTFTPWDWIAGAAAGTATMISTIAAIKSATSTKGYAQGGIVGGNSYSGDNIYAGNAWVNSGEMVLNRFQQQALAGTLENGGMKNISISGALRGEDIVLSADRYGRRTGKGELAFWR